MVTSKTITHQVGKEQEGRYFTIPFDLPDQVACLKIAYRYETSQVETSGEWTCQERINTLSLALLDPTGRLVGSSGARHEQIEIGGPQATPGYRAETIPPGTWSIVYGAYSVAPQGVTAVYTISWTYKTRTWYKGDLHTHTLASDGVLAADELAVHARRHGLDFIAFTDHNAALAPEELPDVPGLTVIPGLEWTHYQGHANMLGTHRPYQGSFHANTLAEVQDRFHQARKQHALIVINHPCDRRFRFHFPIDQLPHDVIEIWNGPMRESNLEAIALWHEMLVDGRKIAACCGSDYHKSSLFQFPGGPCLVVLSWSDEVSDLLAAVAGGHSYMGFGPNCPKLNLTAGDAVVGDTVRWQSDSSVTLELEGLKPGDNIRLIGKKGLMNEWTVARPGKLSAVRPVGEPGFVRVELLRPLVAGLPPLPALLSNPIYFDASSASLADASDCGGACHDTTKTGRCS